MCRKALKSQENPALFFHSQQYGSCNCDSLIRDDFLYEQEENLSKREEKLLVELKHFYEGLQLYNRIKTEIGIDKVRTIDEFEADFESFMKKLNQRAKCAEAIYTQPLPKYSFDESSVIDLENEVRDIELQMITDDSTAKMTEFEKAISELKEIELNNIDMAHKISQKQQNLDNIQISHEFQINDLDQLLKEEEFLYQIALGERKELESLPKVDIQGYFVQQHFKEELEERKNKIRLLNAQVEKDKGLANAHIQKIDSEVNEIQNEIMVIHNQGADQERITEQIQQYKDKKKQIEKELFNADQEKQQIQHSIDNQIGDLQKLEDKRESYKKKHEEFDQIMKSLMERKAEIQRRKAILESSTDQVNALKDELGQMKLKNEELEKEVKKYENLGKEMLEKANKVQDILNEKEIEVPIPTSTQSIQSLKELVQPKS